MELAVAELTAAEDVLEATMEVPIEKRLAKVEQVTQILNVDKHRVYELARDVMPSGVVVRLGRQVRFDVDALNTWIRNGGTKQAA